MYPVTFKSTAPVTAVSVTASTAKLIPKLIGLLKSTFVSGNAVVASVVLNPILVTVAVTPVPLIVDVAPPRVAEKVNDVVETVFK